MRVGERRRFLDPDVLAKIANIELIAKFVVEGFISGLHKSPYHGFSVEFAQYRPYMPGDELRYVDWKVFARTDRYYVKQFEEETNLNCYLLLDTSGSMSYKSDGLSKLEYGSFLTASLAYFMTRQRDAVGFGYFDEELKELFPAKSSTSHLHAILIALERIYKEKEGKAILTTFGDTLHHVADRLSRRGLVILISDLYNPDEKVPVDAIIEEIVDGLSHFRYDGHEVVLFQILDKSEINFEFDQRLVRFKDMETGREIVTDPRAIKQGYLEKHQEFIDAMSLECSKEYVDYNVIDTSTPLDIALLSYLAKREGLM